MRSPAVPWNFIHCKPLDGGFYTLFQKLRLVLPEAAFGRVQRGQDLHPVGVARQRAAGLDDFTLDPQPDRNLVPDGDAGEQDEPE